jgi:hypothetical protein
MQRERVALQWSNAMLSIANIVIESEPVSFPDSASGAGSLVWASQLR